jgi:hypothetical protein
MEAKSCTVALRSDAEDSSPEAGETATFGAMAANVFADERRQIYAEVLHNDHGNRTLRFRTPIQEVCQFTRLVS